MVFFLYLLMVIDIGSILVAGFLIIQENQNIE